MVPAPVDLEWANTLVGLRLKVPSSWWLGCTGNYLHDGKLIWSDQILVRWVLQLNDLLEQEPYLMRWDAVIKYADSDASTYLNYNLPATPILAPPMEAEIGGKKYSRTSPDDWLIVDNGNARSIDQIEFTDSNEQFTVKITPDELESLKDKQGTVRYMNVFEWCLPRFINSDGRTESLWEWQAA